MSLAKELRKQQLAFSDKDYQDKKKQFLDVLEAGISPVAKEIIIKVDDISEATKEKFVLWLKTEDFAVCDTSFGFQQPTLTITWATLEERDEDVELFSLKEAVSDFFKSDARVQSCQIKWSDYSPVVIGNFRKWAEQIGLHTSEIVMPNKELVINVALDNRNMS